MEKLKDEIVRALTLLPMSESTLRNVLKGPMWALSYALESLLVEGRIQKRSMLYHLRTAYERRAKK